MSDEATLELFFERFACVNPFLENRVNGPAPAKVDVPDIHLAAFKRLTSLAGQALSIQRGLGAVLWGDAGIGKSHLLARLARWAESHPAVFIYLHNLQAAPDALPRALLHAIVAFLTGGRRDRFATTPLYSLIRAGLLEATGGPGHYLWSELAFAWHRWLDRLGPAVGDRSIWEVFFAFFYAVTLPDRDHDNNAGAAVRWLSGGALDPEEARRLGLPPARPGEDAVALEDAQEIKQVLVALSRLALAQNRPFVLALDQVDNLDEEQFAALTRFLEALLDTAPNLLVITAGVSVSLNTWRQAGVVQQSAWDRIAQTEVQLQRLTPIEARRLVHARLAEFLAPFSLLAPIRQARDKDELFPLGQAWANEYLLNQIEIRPRYVISLARDAWQRQQAKLERLGGAAWLREWAGPTTDLDIRQVWTDEQRLAAIDQEIERELHAVRNRLHSEPGSLSTDADRLAEVLHEILTRFCEPAYDLVEVLRITPPRRGTPRSYHLSLRRRQPGGEKVIGVLVMASSSAASVTGFLRRLREESRPMDRLVIVTDQRIGLPLGAKGQEYLDELQQRWPDGVEIKELTFSEHAELEALAGVLARAKSGDVQIEPPGLPAQTVLAGEVVASPVWRKRAQEHRLVRELVAPVDASAAQPAPTMAG